jgi:hypothetical protein
MSDNWSADINVVSGALKLWFRELPEPLLTYGLYNNFIEAARMSNIRWTSSVQTSSVQMVADRKGLRMIDYAISSCTNR